MDNNAGASGAGDSANTNNNDRNDNDGNNNDGGQPTSTIAADDNVKQINIDENIDGDVESGASPTKDSDCAKIRQTTVLVESNGFVTKNGHRVVIQPQL